MAIIQTFSSNFQMFVGAKFILGFGVSLQQLGAPILVTELAHPKQRVTLTSIYNTGIIIGLILGAWISFGTFTVESEWLWKLPCLLQVVLPVYQTVMVWLCPESPRWLASRGRLE
ncbi:general substrate transporter [Ilyonectria destructans]|nr:general substrate transporter [Ilyonectria destructans]